MLVHVEESSGMCTKRSREGNNCKGEAGGHHLQGCKLCHDRFGCNMNCSISYGGPL